MMLPPTDSCGGWFRHEYQTEDQDSVRLSPRHGAYRKTVLFTVRVSCRPDVICLRRRIDELTLVTEALRSEQQLLERLKLADARTEGTLGVLA
jgi:uncharacterized protein YneR